MSFSPRTQLIGDGVLFRGWTRTGENLLSDPHGNLTWILRPPQRRTWKGDVMVEASTPGWAVESSDDGAIVRSEDEQAELDTILLGGDVARGFETDSSEPLAILPMRETVGRPEDLTAYLVGGRILTGGPRRGFPIDQVALSLYRVARMRGGAFWDAVATHVAVATADRVDNAPQGRPPSDIWGLGEVHVRYLADAVLLIEAHAEWTGEPRFRSSADRAADGLETFSIRFGTGRWYLHDSVEQDRCRNDLVLNTHVHALTALHACGRDATPGVAALADLIGPRASGAGSTLLGWGIAVCDMARAHGPRRVSRPLAAAALRRAAATAAASRRLRLPGGFIARDASGSEAPAYYLTANLTDLAALTRNIHCPAADTALKEGLRYARASGYLRAEVREAEPLAALIPTMLRNSGCRSTAERMATDLRGAGFSPAIGWPRYEDALWARLQPGTP